MRFSKLFLARGAMTLLLALLTSIGAWAETVNVSYIDENGETQSVDATPLTTDILTSGTNDNIDCYFISPGWYVVNGNVTLDRPLRTNANGDLKIILADDKKLTLENNGNAVNYGMSISGSLFIYGQDNQSGELIINSTKNSIECGYYYGHGGKLTLHAGTNNICISTYNDITIGGGTYSLTSDDSQAIYASYGSLTINGGYIDATASMGGLVGNNNVNITGGQIIANTITGNSTTTLNGTTSDSFIHATFVGQNLIIPEGKTYTDGTNIYSNVTYHPNNSNYNAPFQNKTICPVDGYFVSCPKGVTTANPPVSHNGTYFPIYEEGAEVTLCATTEGYVPVVESAVKTGTENAVTVTDNQFTMPDANVTVSGWTGIPVTYIDPTASAGNQEKEVIAQPITSNMYGCTLNGNRWYVVNDDINIGFMDSDGDASIILADGKSITGELFGNGYYTLSFYGQSEQTGSLSFDYFRCGTLNIYGGIHNYNGGIGGTSTSGDKNVNIYGGQVSGGSIIANNTTLGWTNEEDFIQFNDYNTSINVASGKAFTDGNNNTIKGNDIDKTTIAGVKLIPLDGTMNIAGVNDYTAVDGDVLTGVATRYAHVKIADGATVTLNNVDITAFNEADYMSDERPGIECLGNATIILKGTNSVSSYGYSHPGIYVPNGKNLTIQGEGSLTASGNNGYGYDGCCGAGIGGGGYNASSFGTCGNIEIKGGNVTAIGSNAPGIGSPTNCGNITFSGGVVTATGHASSPSIGFNGDDGTSCGSITINNGVTSLTATKGDNSETIFKSGSSNYFGSDLTGVTSLDGKTRTFYNPANVTTIPVTMNGSGIRTYAGPLHLNFSNVSGLKAYYASAYDKNNQTLNMIEVTGAVPAGTGLLLKGTANTTFDVPVVNSATALSDNLLVGVISATSEVPSIDWKDAVGSVTNLILANGSDGINWYTLSSSGAIGANKAYLQLLTADLPSASRGISMVFDETTGMGDAMRLVNSEQRIVNSDAWYTLDGLRLSGEPTKSGLYIYKGKKVIK